MLFVRRQRRSAQEPRQLLVGAQVEADQGAALRLRLDEVDGKVLLALHAGHQRPLRVALGNPVVGQTVAAGRGFVRRARCVGNVLHPGQPCHVGIGRRVQQPVREGVKLRAVDFLGADVERHQHVDGRKTVAQGLLNGFGPGLGRQVEPCLGQAGLAFLQQEEHEERKHAARAADGQRQRRRHRPRDTLPPRRHAGPLGVIGCMRHHGDASRAPQEGIGNRQTAGIIPPLFWEVNTPPCPPGFLSNYSRRMEPWTAAGRTSLRP